MTLAENKYAPPFTLCLCAMLSGSRSPSLPQGRAAYRLGWEYFDRLGRE